jgi:hypothetical protein
VPLSKRGASKRPQSVTFFSSNTSPALRTIVQPMDIIEIFLDDWIGTIFFLTLTDYSDIEYRKLWDTDA